MKIQCPYCGKKVELDPSKVLGKYVVCSHCGETFHWSKKNGGQKMEVLSEEMLDLRKKKESGLNKQ